MNSGRVGKNQTGSAGSQFDHDSTNLHGKVILRSFPSVFTSGIRQHAVSARWNGQHRVIFVTAGTGERGQKEHQCKNPFGLQIGRLDPVPVAIVSD